MNEALRLVNVAREAMGLDPLAEMPKGVREDNIDCPLAVALQAVVQSYAVKMYDWAAPRVAAAWGTPWVRVYEDVCYVQLPPELAQFIEEFDSGGIPELIDKNAIRDEALNLVNAAREAVGLPVLDRLPVGRVGDCHDCPVARALPARAIDGRWAIFDDSSTARRVADAWGASCRTATHEYGTEKFVVRLPEPLIEFLEEFDQGTYPELIE